MSLQHVHGREAGTRATRDASPHVAQPFHQARDERTDFLLLDRRAGTSW